MFGNELYDTCRALSHGLEDQMRTRLRNLQLSIMGDIEPDEYLENPINPWQAFNMEKLLPGGTISARYDVGLDSFYSKDDDMECYIEIHAAFDPSNDCIDIHANHIPGHYAATKALLSPSDALQDFRVMFLRDFYMQGLSYARERQEQRKEDAETQLWNLPALDKEYKGKDGITFSFNDRATAIRIVPMFAYRLTKEERLGLPLTGPYEFQMRHIEGAKYICDIITMERKIYSEPVELSSAEIFHINHNIGYSNSADAQELFEWIILKIAENHGGNSYGY